MTSRNLKICKTVAKCFGIKVEQLLSKTRRQPIAFARQIAMSLCWERSSEWSSSNADDITGTEFNRDRTTVYNARIQIEHIRTNGFTGEKQRIALCEDAVRRAKL